MLYEHIPTGRMCAEVSFWVQDRSVDDELPDLIGEITLLFNAPQEIVQIVPLEQFAREFRKLPPYENTSSPLDGYVSYVLDDYSRVAER
jgi:hypothetical protein